MSFAFATIACRAGVVLCCAVACKCILQLFCCWDESAVARVNAKNEPVSAAAQLEDRANLRKPERC